MSTIPRAGFYRDVFEEAYKAREAIRMAGDAYALTKERNHARN